MPLDARKKGPLGCQAGEGTANADSGEHSPSPPNTQAEKHSSSQIGFEWSREYQRAIDIISAPIYHGLRIQIMGQAGSGHYPPTSDPEELERFAREVGLDSSYSIITGNGKTHWPVLIDFSSDNCDGNPPKRATQGRPARRVPVVERNP